MFGIRLPLKGKAMARLNKRELPEATIQLAAMIDCVFLLLTYFVITASFRQQEMEMGFQLPGVVEQEQALEFPDEQIIEVTSSGEIIVNDYPYDSPQARHLRELQAMLTRFKQTCIANRTEAAVTIMPQEGATHQRIVRVMDAIHAAGISAVHFAMESY